AKRLGSSDVNVTLIDKRNFHLFQPLLYQVATGGLSPANIAAPLRAILKKDEKTKVLLAEVVDIDPANKQVLLTDGSVSYDTLVVATGMEHSYFGHDEWMSVAPGLKTLEEATEIRARVLNAYEQAERTKDPDVLHALLTFVVVGAGPTGVELAGALKEIAKHTLHDNFRNFRPSDARVILVEHANRVLPPYPEKLSQDAEVALENLGVTVRTGTRVIEITSDHVRVQANGTEETIPTRTVLWAAGVKAASFAKALATATGVETDRLGRLIVEADLSLKGHPDIFVIGDMANYSHSGGAPLPGVAPVAVQQGKYVARLIEKRLDGSALSKPFRYHDLGSMATIGRAAAVAHVGPLQFSGFLAWLTWLFVHLMHLVQFQNRVLVFMQWAWSYLTWNRAARLITNTHAEEAGLPERHSAYS
ncbi:MAG: NAD(P)/FAD-dependent oxidoreductase, partial [Candidatus Hydrogenedentales bacterium]